MIGVDRYVPESVMEIRLTHENPLGGVEHWAISSFKHEGSASAHKQGGGSSIECSRIHSSSTVFTCQVEREIIHDPDLVDNHGSKSPRNTRT